MLQCRRASTPALCPATPNACRRGFGEAAPELLQRYRVPHLFRHDLLACLGYRREDYRQGKAINQSTNQSINQPIQARKHILRAVLPEGGLVLSGRGSSHAAAEPAAASNELSHPFCVSCYLLRQPCCNFFSNSFPDRGKLDVLKYVVICAGGWWSGPPAAAPAGTSTPLPRQLGTRCCLVHMDGLRRWVTSTCGACSAVQCRCCSGSRKRTGTTLHPPPTLPPIRLAHAGRKRWALYPPGRTPPGMQLSVDSDGNPSFQVHACGRVRWAGMFAGWCIGLPAAGRRTSLWGRGALLTLVQRSNSSSCTFSVGRSVCTVACQPSDPQQSPPPPPGAPPAEEPDLASVVAGSVPAAAARPEAPGGCAGARADALPSGRYPPSGGRCTSMRPLLPACQPARAAAVRSARKLTLPVLALSCLQSTPSPRPTPLPLQLID